MNLLGGLKNKLTTQIKETSFSGAIDIIVIQNENDRLASTPFYCKFGKVLISESTELTVDIKINDQFTSTFRMAFTENGDSAYVQNSFNSIIKNEKLNQNEKKNSKSNLSVDDYLKAAKALQNAIINSETNPIESNSSQPLFYIQLNDCETLSNPSILNVSSAENETLNQKYSESQNSSKIFELTSDQLKCFKLNHGIYIYIQLLN